MVTVDSSTKMPIAKANPLKVIILMVCPTIPKMKTPESKEIGIVIITIIDPLISPKNSNIISPVRMAPITPSDNKLFTALITYILWSNS